MVARQDTVNPNLTPIRRRRDRPPRETPEVIRDLSRFVRAMGRRVGNDGDHYDLPLIRDLHQSVAEAMEIAVNGLRERDTSDGQIAEALGISRQAVGQHWPRRRTS